MFRNRSVFTSDRDPRFIFTTTAPNHDTNTTMFVNRRNTQKPDEDLYASFRQNFPGVGPGTSSADPASIDAPTDTRRSSILSEAIVDEPPIPNGMSSTTLLQPIHLLLLFPVLYGFHQEPCRPPKQKSTPTLLAIRMLTTSTGLLVLSQRSRMMRLPGPSQTVGDLPLHSWIPIPLLSRLLRTSRLATTPQLQVATAPSITLRPATFTRLAWA